MTNKSKKRKARKTSKLAIWASISGQYQLRRLQHKQLLKRFFGVANTPVKIENNINN
jgi:hypothetical protein